MDTKLPDDDFSPAPVPNGMSAPAISPMGPAPEPKFEDSVCNRGENGCCAHLWQIVTNFSHGNPDGTFANGKEPKAVHRSCTVSPAEEMQLKGLVVMSCNRHSDPTQRKDPKPFIFEVPEESDSE